MKSEPKARESRGARVLDARFVLLIVGERKRLTEIDCVSVREATLLSMREEQKEQCWRHART